MKQLPRAEPLLDPSGVAQLPGGGYVVRASWEGCVEAINAATRTGRLVKASGPHPDTSTPGMYIVELRLLQVRIVPAAGRPQPWYRESLATAVTAVATGLTLTGLGVWALSVVIPVLPELFQMLIVVLVVGLLGWLALGQVGACPGLHCPGCKCGRG